MCNEVFPLKVIKARELQLLLIVVIGTSWCRSWGLPKGHISVQQGPSQVLTDEISETIWSFHLQGTQAARQCSTVMSRVCVLCKGVASDIMIQVEKEASSMCYAETKPTLVTPNLYIRYANF
jgi:hypothetical protein